MLESSAYVVICENSIIAAAPVSLCPMGHTALNMDTGFPYSALPNACVLILGSMPSRASLAAAQYYAHPRNAFWSIMAQMFGFDPALPYQQRLYCLREFGIALWDVTHQCVRPGSLDANMRHVIPNNFNTLFATHRHIRAIFFNGCKAAALYRQLALPELENRWNELPRTCLPSTSPAHAARSFAEKLAVWQTVKETLETGSA